MPLELRPVAEYIRRATTEDLLDRVTVYRDDMEPAAVDLMENELWRRGLTRELMAVDTSRDSAARGTEPILRISGLRKAFNPGTPNEVRALQGVDLAIHPGSFVAVIGTNGSGKSTLLNAIAGTFLPDSGTLMLDGQDITGIAASVFHPEPVTGGIAFRSINLPMGVLGLGMHIFEVSLSLSDGSQTRAAAVWNVLRSR